MTIFIYAIRHGITREALHVGQTKNLRARFNGHRCVNGKFTKIGQPPWCLPFPFPVKMELLAVTDSAHANEAEQCAPPSDAT